MDEDFVKIAVIVVVVLGRAIAWVAKQRRENASSAPAPQPQRPARARPVPPPLVKPARTSAPAPRRPAARPPEPARPRGLDPAVQRALDALKARAERLSLALDQQRSARRFLPAVDDWLPAQLKDARTQLMQSGTEAQARGRLAILGLVLDEVELMAADRRRADLGGALGDADALASACYAPIVAHARSRGLPLTVAEPAARWGNFQMAIWSGFIPTGVAPIFLPEDFFRRTAWWPAVAHEIGHSFLASLRGLDAGLRRQLGLVDEWTGRRPLQLGESGLQLAELERVLGGWFEELFCDVFGTMMCGPAYVRTMSTLFAARGDAREVLAVASDGQYYDMHPPRHLRLIAGCQVLRRAGLHEEAGALRGEWDARHALSGNPPDRILFPMRDGLLAVPLAPLERLVVDLADRLYAGPFEALGGVGLEDISGLDYGPHEHLEGIRARDALLAGRVPSVRDARAVIAGAVLAAHARPGEEAKILERARAAIPGRDTGEVRPDAYQLASLQAVPRMAGAAAAAARRAPARRVGKAGGFSAAELRDAIVLGAVLERPGARRRRP